MNLRFNALWMMFGLTWTACSPGPVPISQSPRDPSNPTAPEGVVPPLGLGTPPSESHGAATGVPAPAEGHAHHHHDDDPSRSARAVDSAVASDAGAGSVVYSCPMHPEVTAAAPGKCSKCGMNLVPRK